MREQEEIQKVNQDVIDYLDRTTKLVESIDRALQEERDIRVSINPSDPDNFSGYAPLQLGKRARRQMLLDIVSTSEPIRIIQPDENPRM